MARFARQVAPAGTQSEGKAEIKVRHPERIGLLSWASRASQDALTVAASSAWPGIFPPQPIGDRRCMDGGAAGTDTHLDLIAGCERAVVLALTDGTNDAGAMTEQAAAEQRELSSLESSGTHVFWRVPEAVDLEKLLDPRAVKEAIASGRRQAETDAADLASFLAA
jgi:NTE family protein